MTYELVYTRRAARDLDKLDREALQRIRDGLERYREHPYQFATKLTNAELGTYRFRMGDYRVIFDVDDNKIVVLRVGHRRDIYRRG